MLNEIVRWMSDRKTDRRTADRKKVQFSVAWVRGEEMIAGIGTEISLNGMAFATKTAPPTPSFNVLFDVSGRRYKARLTTVRSEAVMREGANWTVLACTFEGIAADDYAYRLLPMGVQKRIGDILMQNKRLAPESDPRNPLLRMKYLGSKAGKHRFAVHSRVAVADEMQQYDSAFTVDETGITTLD